MRAETQLSGVGRRREAVPHLLGGGSWARDPFSIPGQAPPSHWAPACFYTGLLPSSVETENRAAKLQVVSAVPKPTRLSPPGPAKRYVLQVPFLVRLNVPVSFQGNCLSPALAILIQPRERGADGGQALQHHQADITPCSLQGGTAMPTRVFGPFSHPASKNPISFFLAFWAAARF